MLYLCLDLKSYYASKECVDRGLNPMTANLLVADASRTDQTICLAVTPALKALGVPSRPRLFEAKQRIREAEQRLHRRIEYIIAPPRMQVYLETSRQIHSILLRYAAPEDIHVYSIDESFIDVTPYLHLYHPAKDVTAARKMATCIVRDILSETGITATVGIGTNLFLCKVAMDVLAKKAKPDRTGMRIASLDERSYRHFIWPHTPITDIWQIGRGTRNTLARYGMHTMGDVARMSLDNEALLYHLFGINAEILIDHAWGIEPVTMAHIKNFRPESNSRSMGQVLPRPYRYDEARIVFAEMIDLLSLDLFRKSLVSDCFSYSIGYDHRSVTEGTYRGPLHIDHYGRPTPPHTNTTVRLDTPTSSSQILSRELLSSFSKKVNRELLFRRMTINANDVRPESDCFQQQLFIDYHEQEREKRLRYAILEIKKRYGKNAILRASNLLDSSTMRERNAQIGGHHS